jgi:glutathione S-transferase
MALTLHYLWGSPYAWRVWLALEHKRIAYDLKALSYDAGDFKNPTFRALNPRQRVPVIVGDGFALYGSAAIVEYREDKQPNDRRVDGAHAGATRRTEDMAAALAGMSAAIE